ncbi:hypothetical protein QIA21_04950 (plasmid) [Borreliella japonica]
MFQNTLKNSKQTFNNIKTDNMTSYMGLIITGDQFIDHQNFQEISEEFENAIAIYMESAAMAQVALQL